MDEDQQMRTHAREVVNELFCGDYRTHPEGITPEWLQSLHPELSEEDAVAYWNFCRAKTIVFKGCYGDGGNMWPAWQAFSAEVAAL